MPQSYVVEARTVAPGVSVAESREAVGIEIDTSSGMDPTRPGPAELLAMALAACVLKNVQRFSEMLGFAYRSASVRVEAEREESPPRFSRLRYRLEIDTDEPDRRVDLLHRNLVRYGTVYNTLAAACEVEGEVVARRSLPR